MTALTPVTIVNHVAADLAASPDAIWNLIVESFADGSKFGESGYEIGPTEDVVLGGFRMKRVKDGAVVDDRIVHVTERDEAARRLSMFADYLSEPGGLQVYVTYQAHAIPNGARYTLDCHSRMKIDGGADLAAAVAAKHAEFQVALEGFFARLETQYGRAPG